jgi:hypothetical protein
VEMEKCNNLFLHLFNSHSVCSTCIYSAIPVGAFSLSPLFELWTLLILKVKPGGGGEASFLSCLVTPVFGYQLMNYTVVPRKQSEEILKCTFHCRLDVMQVQSCARRPQLFPFFLISNLLFLLTSFFFRCYFQRYLVWFLFQLFICLFVCLFVCISGSEILVYVSF